MHYWGAPSPLLPPRLLSLELLPVYLVLERDHMALGTFRSVVQTNLSRIARILHTENRTALHTQFQTAGPETQTELRKSLGMVRT